MESCSDVEIGCVEKAELAPYGASLNVEEVV